jgi:hypothetical protein
LNFAVDEAPIASSTASFNVSEKMQNWTLNQWIQNSRGFSFLAQRNMHYRSTGDGTSPYRSATADRPQTRVKVQENTSIGVISSDNPALNHRRLEK